MGPILGLLYVSSVGCGLPTDVITVDEAVPSPSYSTICALSGKVAMVIETRLQEMNVLDE